MLEFNVAANTQIGKVDIEEKIHMKENPYMDDKYNRGGDFLDNMASDNYIEFCNRWFKLASFQEMLDDIDEYFQKNSCFGKYRDIANDPFSPIIPTTSSIVEPISFYEIADNPINTINDLDSSITYTSIVTNGRFVR
jgi:hypothetical protein